LKVSIDDIITDKLSEMYKNMQEHYGNLIDNMFGNSKDKENGIMNDIKTIHDKLDSLEVKDNQENNKQRGRKIKKRYVFDSKGDLLDESKIKVVD